METVIITILILAVLYWFFILRPGRLDFWKVASKHPDLAYDFFVSKDCWQVFEDGLPDNYQTIIPPEEWVGPFRLWVPKLGNKMIHIFGRTRDYEEAQNDFMRKIRENI